MMQRRKTRLTRVWCFDAFRCRCEQTSQSFYKKYGADARIQSLFETYARRVEMYVYLAIDVMFSEFFSLRHLLR